MVFENLNINKGLLLILNHQNISEEFLAWRTRTKMGPFGGLPPPMLNMRTPSRLAAEPALPDPGLGSQGHPREPAAKVEKVMGKWALIMNKAILIKLILN